MPDLYGVLGVARTATPDEIKRAYRQKALSAHPDKGGDEAAFQALQHAHEVLMDEQRRRVYDATGRDDEAAHGAARGAAHGPFGFGPGGGIHVDLGSMFGGVFGGAGAHQQQPRQRPKGADKVHDVALPLGAFYHGKRFAVRFRQARKCKGCDGGGGAAYDACGACGGAGREPAQHMVAPGFAVLARARCDACAGAGKKATAPCGTCAGARVVATEAALESALTPGMGNGASLTFEGACSDEAGCDRPGDVVLRLHREDPEGGPKPGEPGYLCWPKGEPHLWVTVLLPLPQAIGGFATVVDHPRGGVAVAWDAPLLHGAVLRVAGAGMPLPAGAGGGFGDLFVQVAAKPFDGSVADLTVAVALAAAAKPGKSEGTSLFRAAVALAQPAE
jgi:DnaJ-class molecular chaperone